MKTTKLQQEKKILHQRAKASDAIRQKHKLIGRDMTQQIMSEIFKPMVTPLKQLADKKLIEEEPQEIKIKKEEPKEEVESKQESLTPDYEITDDDSYTTATITHQSTPIKDIPVVTYLKMFDSKLLSKELDTKYGIRKLKGNRLMMDDSEVRFDNNFIYIGDKKYNTTSGLLELLFMNSLDQSKITKEDKNTYDGIISMTNAYRKHYLPDRSIRVDKNLKKFTDIISKYIPKSGESLPQYMIKHKQNYPTDYIYWDDPNELVGRLRLLIASQTAGNFSHTNEILSILEKLRKAKIIH
ncbi:uncharacterized protein [Chelonus insularis]|uniref:uncharacterized protein n=1 Tax=Chelonus insularis TaxID=460826 RepID=UPI00158D6F1E|nr:uncharacterized protein LOC118069695 [Chelonus insularis]